MKVWILWIALSSSNGVVALDRMEFTTHDECSEAAARIRPQAEAAVSYVGLTCIQQTLPEPPK